ncbi:clavesin-1-like [Culicoides brevitarsis]|uniref:clavesin-1-like n=1 Tax=Culicoides brevitarsis TaxID=469753 RepID=UPI00307BAD7C
MGLKKMFSKSHKMEAIPIVDKAPEKYDTYEWTLSDEYAAIAAKVLHENESVRTQSLAQMREWIAKDPYIVSCRTDAAFLMRFLRVKKFNVPAACAQLTKYLVNRQLYPAWYTRLDVDDPLIVKLLLDGFFIPLPDRDSRGRQIVIYRFQNLDPAKYTSTDVFRLQELCFQTMFDDEESQICGYVCVFDYSGMTMQHVAMFSLVDFRNFCSLVRKSVPIRITSILVLNMPAFLHAFYEITMSILQQKLRERFQMFKNLEDFRKEVDIEMFPVEYGGKLKIKSIMQDFQRRMHAKREKILALDEMCIDIPKDMKGEWYQQDSNGNIEAGVIGSFRKLEVD